MSRRSRKQPSLKLGPRSESHEEIQRLVAAEVERRLSQMTLPPGAKVRPLNQDALMAQMMAQQAPAKEGTPMFAPGAPLMPAPGLSIQGMPRQYSYNVGYNIQAAPRSSEDTPFTTLRNLVALYDGAQLCEQVWLDTVAKLTLKIKVRDEIIAEQGKAVSATKYADKIRQYTDFFAMPDVGNGYDLKAWLRAAVRDQLQIDAVAIYVRRNRAGGVYSLELVDGASIKPLIDPRGRRPQPPYPAYQQYLYGVPAGLYTSEEMLYQRETTRTESIYGLSRAERIIVRINQALRKENKDLARFTDGNIPPGILTPPDDGSQWTPDQLLAYQDMWDALLAGNDQARSRIKVIQPGSSITSLQDQDIFVDFDRFLLNVTAACYSMTMADLGFTENVNKSSGESQENVFYRRAVQPLMDRYATLFTFVLRHYFNEQDLVVAWSGFEESEDFNANAASYVSLVNTGIVSPTTAAHLMNLPWSGADIPNYVLTKDGITFLEDAADPGTRKALNDAKVASAQLAAQPPPLPAKSQDTIPNNDSTETPDNDAQATQSDEKPRSPTVVTGKGKGSASHTPPAPTSGAKGDASKEPTPPGSVAKGGGESSIRRTAPTHTGVMIAFMLKSEIAAQLALSGGEPAQDLHCTLAFMGDMYDDPPNGKRSPATSLDELRVALQGFAGIAHPLSGEIGGLARFAPGPSSDGKSPVVALVNAPGLQEWRRTLVGFIESASYSIANTFDYTPHITLAYIDEKAPMPINDVPSLPLIFDEICLAVGNDRYSFPLSGGSNNERVETSAITRRSPPQWRAPSQAQIDLEARLAKAVKAFIASAKISKDGVELPGDPEHAKLLDEITICLEEAVHQGRTIATGMEERGLISAAKNLAGRAVQVISDISQQIQDKVAEIIDNILGTEGSSGFDEGEVLGEVEAWAEEYAEMVGVTEVTSAIESSVLDSLTRSGATDCYWLAEPDACPLCMTNADASPLPIGTAFPSGDTSPGAHPRCRCNIAPA